MIGRGTARATLVTVIIDLAWTCLLGWMVYRRDWNFWLPAAVTVSTAAGLVELAQMCSVGLV